jgi:hypothetical protein
MSSGASSGADIRHTWSNVVSQRILRYYNINIYLYLGGSFDARHIILCSPYIVRSLMAPAEMRSSLAF